MSDSKKLQLEQRDRFLRNLIKEAVINVIAEQQPLPVQTSAVPPATPGIAPETNASEELQPPPEQAPDQPEQFTPEAMVEKLNVLRGGRSFTDPEVFGRLTGFFNNLTDEQKSGLDHTLTELGKAVIGATEEEAGLEDPAQQQQSASLQPPPPPPAPSAPGPGAPVSPSV